MNWLAIVAIGAAVGFLGGVFGKGGAAVATPLLAAFGVPPFIAVAAPLPATIPSTAVASGAYWRHRLIDRTVVVWSLGVGIPATVLGALASQFVDGHLLVVATDVVVAGLGLRFGVWGADRTPDEVADAVAAMLARGIGRGP